MSDQLLITRSRLVKDLKRIGLCEGQIVMLQGEGTASRIVTFWGERYLAKMSNVKTWPRLS